MKNIFYSFAFSTLFYASADAQAGRSIESILANNVSIIKFGAGGKVWVGMPGSGCAVYDPAGPSWTPFSTSTTIMKSDTVTAIDLFPVSAVPHSFMATTNGVYYFHAGTWDSLTALPNPHVTGIIKSPNNKLFISTLSGISEYDATTLQHQADYNTGNSSLPYDRISFLQYKQIGVNGFYAATPDSGYFFTNDLINYSVINTANSNLLDNRINCLLVKSDTSKHYVGTPSGLSIYSAGLFQNLTTNQGLPQNDITAVDVDCKGNTWIGTRDSGVVIYDGTNMLRLNRNNGLRSNRITAINCRSLCDCWVGTADSGVSVADTARSIKEIYLGQEEIAALNTEANVFPQPTKGELNFTFDHVQEAAELTLYDMTGKRVADQFIRNSVMSRMDIQSLEAGIYIYHLTSRGQVLTRGKVTLVR